MSAHGHSHHDDHHGHAPAHGTFGSYMIGFGLSVILTAIPFWLVMTGALGDPQLRTQWRRDGDAAVLTLQADRLARALWVDFEGLDAELSDNALTLLPGETVQLRVRADADLARLRQALRLRWLGAP